MGAERGNAGCRPHLRGYEPSDLINRKRGDRECFTFATGCFDVADRPITLKSPLRAPIFLLRGGCFPVVGDPCTLFLASGSDYTSYFVAHSKKSIFDTWLGNARFVCPTDDECLGNIENIHAAANSFYRLVGSFYFQGHKKLFGLLRADQLLAEVSAGDNDDDVLSRFLHGIRMKTWVACSAEKKRIPTIGALRFHFLRAVAAMEVWEQALTPIMRSPALDQRGYIVSDGVLSIRHDTEENERNVLATTKHLMNGCGCGGHCKTKRCPCKKQGRACGPACKCTDCCNCDDCGVAGVAAVPGGTVEVGAQGEVEVQEEEHFCGSCEVSMGGDIGNVAATDDARVLCEGCAAIDEMHEELERDGDDEMHSDVDKDEERERVVETDGDDSEESEYDSDSDTLS
jgi:hypothetical protein